MGELTFLSISRECFKSLICPETVVLSMMYDKNLIIPDNASAVQLEQSRSEGQSYGSEPIQCGSSSKAKEKKHVEKTEQIWAPHIQVGKRVPTSDVPL